MQGFSALMAWLRPVLFFLTGLPAVLLLAACTGQPAATGSDTTAATATRDAATAPDSLSSVSDASVAEGPGIPASVAGAPVKVYLVNYTASWCPNCKVLEPKLKLARTMLEQANTPVEEVRVDYSTEGTLRASLPNLAARNLSGLLQRWDGITGLVVLAAADTGEPIDCLNRQFSAEAIANFAKAAVERVATTKPGERFLGGAVCPPPGVGGGS